jgi:hypothetical protein
MRDAVRKQQIFCTSHASHAFPELVKMHPILLCNGRVLAIYEGGIEGQRVTSQALHQVHLQSDKVPRDGHIRRRMPPSIQL